jgi:bifunctional ADP-heptose synthase (sugar kinase/adenylyltransferase)
VKCLVLGDLIIDKYRMCTATRLCPEAPAIVLVEQKTFESAGGAGLVVAQLNELLGSEHVHFLYGGESEKERIFADGHLITRIDRDSIRKSDSNAALQILNLGYQIDSIVISDYGKGALTEELAKKVVHKANELNIPVFVDAKNNFSWYAGSFAAFPNEKEFADCKQFNHVVQKFGANGAWIDGVHIPTNPHAVRDTTGAGDCFLAAFVYKYLSTSVHFRNAQFDLEDCVRFANKVAGISVEYIGTHTVSKEELDNSQINDILYT